MEESNFEINEDLDFAELAVVDVFECIYKLGGEILHDNYITKKSLPFAAEHTVALLSNIMELYYIRHDLGEIESWNEEIEPKPCVIDP